MFQNILTDIAGQSFWTGEQKLEPVLAFSSLSGEAVKP